MNKIASLLFLLVILSSSTKQSELLFEEHFNGTQLNEKSWSYDVGNGCPKLCGWGNNELQWYAKENVAIKDGHLVITATHNNSKYKSGKIHTKDKVEFTYGTIEVRAKLATGKGLWPAIWLLGSDIDEVGWPACGEIDMMEYVGKEPNKVFTSLHTPASYGNTINTRKLTVPGIEEGFHIYKTTWTKEAIVFYVDDTEVYRFAPKVKNDKTWPFNKPFYLIVNLAIGGNFGGPEVDDRIFPKELAVDYIKVYKN